MKPKKELKNKILPLVLLPFVFSVIGCKGSGGGDDKHNQNFVLNSQGAPIFGNVYLSVFDQKDADEKYNEVTSHLVLKENESYAYRSDISRACGTDMADMVATNSSFSINLDYKVAPLNKYFDENLDPVEGTQFRAAVYFMPITGENKFYKLNIDDYQFNYTFEYDYQVDEDNIEHISVTKSGNEGRDPGYDYFRSNSTIATISWLAKQEGHEASKIKNQKLTFSGKIIANYTTVK